MLSVFLYAPAHGDRETRRTPVVQVVERVLPGVVNIGTEKIVQIRYTDPFHQFRRDIFDDFFRDFFGPPRESYQLRHSLGSGVIIDPSGYILTNFHVVERASRIRVTLADHTEYEAAFVAGDALNDLALIKINPDRPLTAIELAEDDDLILGETVIVLGNPFGLEHTVTVGVLSAIDREARYGGQVLFRDILQTDAAVNPGNSGGPMLNLDGRLIGINVAIHREAQNIGFGVPVKRVRDLVGRWLTPLYLRKLTPGFEVVSQDGALVVASIIPIRSDRKSAVREGDRILAVAGALVSSLFDYHRALLPLEPGQEFTVTIQRNGQTIEVPVSLQTPERPAGALLAMQRLGIEFAETPALGEEAAVGKGLMIQRIKEKSQAETAGLRPGMLITQINGLDIHTPDDVGYALQFVRPGELVRLAWSWIEKSGAFLIVQQSTVTLKAL